ncbi:MAG: hypothetical protein HY821_22450 [Acidobacteria bacterium]|nr:hypothetical protein [Acidobacteriota bacterium]
MTKQLMFCVAVSMGVAAAQTRPAEPEVGGRVRAVLGEIAKAQATTKAILAELDKTPPQVKSAEALLPQAVAQSKSILSGIEAVDVVYDQLSDAQKDALREAWSIAMVMYGCVEPPPDQTVALQSPDRAGEIRTSVECAQRRTAQLKEMLPSLGSAAGGGGRGQGARPRSN